MTSRTLLWVLAFAGIAAAAPVEKVFYEWLSPDLTTVLCSSLIPGSCDPYDGGADGEERFLGSYTDFAVLPHSLRAITQIFSDIQYPIEETENRLRLSYSFEAEWDLGTYAFVGGTGDFLTKYDGACGEDNGLNVPGFSFSVSSALPTDDLCFAGGPIYRLETFDKPFEHKGHYSVFFSKIDPLVFDGGPNPGIDTFWVGDAFDPDTGYLLEDVRPQLVQVAAPIPEPTGLTITGLAAILSAVGVRRARHRSRDA